MDHQEILFYSSEVQKLEEGDHGPELCFHPHRHVIDPKMVKAIYIRQLYRIGTAPRYLNHGNDVLIFCDENHRQRWLKNQGFSDEWIKKNLLPFAEVFHLPVHEEIIPENQKAEAA